MNKWLEVNLGAIKHNLHKIRSLTSSKICAVVKANAYGHGLVGVAKAIDKDVDFFAVGSTQEAITLRENGIKSKILSLYGADPKDARKIVDYQIDQSVYSFDVAKALSRAGTKNKRARVHVKIDTGLGRLGVPHEEGVEFISKIAKSRNIRVEGLHSTFVELDDEAGYQVEKLTSINEALYGQGIEIPLVHIASSYSLDMRWTHLDMIRIGAKLYGIGNDKRFKPALSFKARIQQVRDCQKGGYVGYDGFYVTKKPIKVATLNVGYCDGLPRALVGKGKICVNGHEAKIVGKVMMNHTIIDTTGMKVKQDDVCEIISDRMPTSRVAKLANQTEYELLGRLPEKLPRIYV